MSTFACQPSSAVRRIAGPIPAPSAPVALRVVTDDAAVGAAIGAADRFVDARHPAAAEAAPDWLTAPFDAISLEQLNAKADMLERRDNKYVVRADVLRAAMAELARDFDVLEIDGKRDFGYDTCYFDDAAHSSYFAHHKGRRIRCKVRMRKYVEAGLCFVEVKLKHIRGMTIKKRLRRPVEMHGRLDAEAIAFIHDCYRELYGREYRLALQPALEMSYQRVTLVAKEGGERMTVDFRVVFKGTADARSVDGDLYLVETKSRNANGIADKVLRALHQHPTNSCSKYCVALAALERVHKYNKFLVALRRLEVRPDRDAANGPAFAAPAAVAGSAL